MRTRQHRTGRKLSKALVPAAAVSLLVVGPGITSAGAAEHAQPAKAKDATCSGGDISGTFRNLTVTGPCQVPAGATLRVNGTTLVTGSAAVLLSEFAPAFVTLNGDVTVNNGGLLAVGNLNMGHGCPTADTATSVINGNVTLDNALSVKLDCTTVNGNVTSARGGQRGFGPHCEEKSSHPLNFVVKDNVINGDVAIHSWQGCWLGVIRNTISGRVSLYNNHPKDVDANEVLMNTIGGNLGCSMNTPAPQVGDALGTPPPPPPYNLVAGYRTGQCKGL